MTDASTRTSELFSGVLSDVLDTMGIFGQVAAHPFHLLGPAVPVVGTARTARAVSVSTPPAQPYHQLLDAIDSLGDTDVLVVSAPSTSTSALFGGLLATAVTQSNGAGAVIDGLVRDTGELRRIGLPTAARGLSPLDSYGRDEVVEVAGPVSIGGVTVRDGDFVLCDEDGLVAVPAAVTGEVVRRALEKIDRESTMRTALRDGMSVAVAFEKFGVL